MSWQKTNLLAIGSLLFFGAESPLHLSLRSVPWVDNFQRSHNSLTLKQVLSQPENYQPINGP